MTVASTAVPCPNGHARVKRAGINRLALVIGLALVSWGRRPSNRVPPTHEELHLRRQVQRESELARADYAASRTFYGLIR